MTGTDRVRAYYDNTVAIEWERLATGWLEYAITSHFIERAASPGSEILDIGGGPGRYAIDLTAKGHHVDLADLSPESIAFAKDRARNVGIALRSARTMDARDLSSLPDDSYDLVLCLGPMYHLLEEVDRVRAAQECLRVLRPGGFGFFAFISRYAPLHFAIKTAPKDIATWEAPIRRGMEQGRYDPEETHFFTNVVLADPDEVQPFMAQFGVEEHVLFGAEGGMAQGEAVLRGLPAAQRQRWLELGIVTASTRAGLFASEHLVFAARKPAATSS